LLPSFAVPRTAEARYTDHMRTVLAAILLLSARAYADDCDLTDAAGGTASTALAEDMDRAAGQVHTGPPGETPVTIAVPPRAEHGFYVGLDGTGGAVSRISNDDAAAGGHLAANAQAGWLAGLHACNKTDVIAGNESAVVNRFAVAWPWFFMAGALATEQDWHVRPKLDSGRLWLRRPYVQNSFTASMAVAEWRRADGGTSAVMPVRYTTSEASQDRFRAVYGAWRMSMYESHSGDTQFEILPIELDGKYPAGLGTDQNPNPASTALDTIEAADVTTRIAGVKWHAAFGGAWAYGSTEHICGGCVPVVGELSAAWPVAGGTLEVGAARSAHLAMDDVITVEDRVGADFKRDSQHHAIRAAAFTALTRTSAHGKPQLTGGSSVGLDVKLPAKIVAAFDVAVARSYYGRLDGDVTPTPQLAGLGTMSLERRFNFIPR
jgi:hypothetical protein